AVRRARYTARRSSVCGVAARPRRACRQPRPRGHVGRDGRLRDDEPQRARLHEPCAVRKARRVQGPWFLRRGWHRYGAVLGSAHDRRAREDRLPPARVWGSPTTALWAHRIGIQRAKRLLFTGDSLSGAEAAEWGLAIE